MQNEDINAWRVFFSVLGVNIAGYSVGNDTIHLFSTAEGSRVKLELSEAFDTLNEYFSSPGALRKALHQTLTIQHASHDKTQKQAVISPIISVDNQQIVINKRMLLDYLYENLQGLIFLPTQSKKYNTLLIQPEAKSKIEIILEYSGRMDYKLPILVAALKYSLANKLYDCPILKIDITFFNRAHVTHSFDMFYSYTEFFELMDSMSYLAPNKIKTRNFLTRLFEVGGGEPADIHSPLQEVLKKIDPKIHTTILLFTDGYSDENTQDLSQIVDALSVVKKNPNLNIHFFEFGTSTNALFFETLRDKTGYATHQYHNLVNLVPTLNEKLSFCPNKNVWTFMQNGAEQFYRFDGPALQLGPADIGSSDPVRLNGDLVVLERTGVALGASQPGIKRHFAQFFKPVMQIKQRIGDILQHISEAIPIKQMVDFLCQYGPPSILLLLKIQCDRAAQDKGQTVPMIEF